MLETRDLTKVYDEQITQRKIRNFFQKLRHKDIK